MRKPRSTKGGERAPLDAGAARGRALKLLSRREHAAAELSHKLQQRGAERAVAEEAVQAMREAGWQSDTRYAEMLLRNRAEQGYGPRRIRAELEAARVPAAQIRALFEHSDHDWTAHCAQAWQRKFKTAARDAAGWQKQYRFLLTRGFDSDSIRAVLKRPRGVEEDFPEDLAD